jgi:signal transduction histidine kinase
MSTTTNPDGELIEDECIFEKAELPVVKYNHQTESSNPDIIYTNDTYENNIQGAVVDGCTPVFYTDGGAQPNSDGTCDTDVDTVAVDEVKNSLLDTHQIVIDVFSDEGTRKYVCTEITVDETTSVELYRDITKEHHQEVYLDVLQRILRHNLRNDLNVILGHAQTLLNEVNDGTQMQKSLDAINSNAKNLATIVEETKTIRRIINDDEKIDHINLNDITKDVVTEYITDSPDVEITYIEEDDVEIRGTHRVRSLIDSLLSNAIEHNSGKQVVDVRITTDDTDRVILSVSDNGTGIEQTHKDIIKGEEEITSLNHGSGIGLWVVRWVADRNGAEINFERNDSGGTVVEVTFQTP